MRPWRIAVLGDSHAGAYESLLQQVAAIERIPVEIYQAPGCPLFPFRALPGEVSPACAALRDDLLQRVDGHADRRRRAVPAGAAPAALPRRLERAARRERHARSRSGAGGCGRGRGELRPAARPLLARGVRIVVEAPKPIFRTAPVRCADWFTAA